MTRRGSEELNHFIQGGCWVNSIVNRLALCKVVFLVWP